MIHTAGPAPIPSGLPRRPLHTILRWPALLLPPVPAKLVESSMRIMPVTINDANDGSDDEEEEENDDEYVGCIQKACGQIYHIFIPYIVLI